MGKSKIDAFINKLAKATINDKIYWNHLTNLQNIFKESNPAISYLLVECEFHHINYSDSYYAIINNGEVYILNDYIQCSANFLSAFYGTQ